MTNLKSGPEKHVHKMHDCLPDIHYLFLTEPIVTEMSESDDLNEAADLADTGGYYVPHHLEPVIDELGLVRGRLQPRHSGHWRSRCLHRAP